jgi:hypothetical protein
MGRAPEVKIGEDRRLLVSRVMASSYFNKSARLRDLLVHLTDRVLDDEAAEIHEQEVGHRVFGRAVDYDTAADNIVRVHASMLRKRLEQYFAAEGAGEPVVIEIPKKNYAPVFRERSRAEAEPLVEAAPVPARVSGRDWLLLSAIVCALVFIASTVVLLVRGTPRSDARSGPTVRQFWSQILSPNRATDVVVDDAAVALYQELTGHAISLDEYFDRSYLRTLPAVAHAAGLDPQVATAMSLRRQSSFADTSFSWKLEQLAAAQNARTNLRFARDYSFRDLKANNAILLGTARSNPWIQPLETQLQIRWRFDQAGGVYYPVDTTNPDRSYKNGGPGQARDGFFSIALLPNLGGTGNVLMVSATGGSATNAAAEFLANDKALHDLRGQLPPGKGPGFPFFEALVRAQSRSGATRDVEVVFRRAVPR